MMNPIGLGLAMAATASLGFAGTNGDPTKNDPLLDSLFQSNVTVKYKVGEGVTFEGGKDYSLNIRGRLAAGWYYTSTDDKLHVPGGVRSINSFQARHARLAFSGFVWDSDITYKLQVEGAAGLGVLDPNVGLIDAAIGYRFWKEGDNFAGVNLGLQKGYAGLQSDTDSGMMEFSERSMASQTFGNSRAVGAMFYGGFGKADHGSSFMAHAGAMNNDTATGAQLLGSPPAFATNESQKLDFTFGAMFAPNGTEGSMAWSEGDLAHSGNLDSAFGANLTIANDPVFGPGSATTFNFFAAAKFGNGFAAQGELWLRTDDPNVGSSVDSNGWYLQASYTTAPGSGTQWGFGGRVSMVTINDTLPAGGLPILPSLQGSIGALGGITKGDVTEIQGVVNAYYHEHKLKTQLGLTFQDINADTGGTDSTNFGIDALVTLAF